MADYADEEIIDYPALIDNAMRGVVRQALEHGHAEGLPGDHHFFISFQTAYPGVDISDTLKTRYPEEMTIVLQHQFWDLTVEQDKFSVMLSFNNTPEKLVIPFDALTAFADPSIKFGLQFHGKEYEEDEELSCPATGKRRHEPPPSASFDEDPPSEDHPPANDTKVVALDAFRKNK